MIDYLERKNTITGVYHAQLIRKLRDTIQEKRRGKLHQGVVFHQDNAPAHTSAIAMTIDTGLTRDNKLQSLYQTFPQVVIFLRGNTCFGSLPAALQRVV